MTAEISGKNTKGLRRGSVGIMSAVVIGMSCVAPAYTLSGALGPTVSEVGSHLPAVLLIGFIPMFLVALGYRELNTAMPDSGTTFAWATRAFGPWVGWLGAWGLLASTILVLSSLAGVAVDFFYLLLAQIFRHPDLAHLTDNTAINILTCLVIITLATAISYRGMETTKSVQYILVGFQILVLLIFACMALWHVHRGTAFDAIPFSLEWFNPFGVGSFGALASGIALTVFIYWGWDVVLTMSEETKGASVTPGKAAVSTILVILAVYECVACAALAYSGTGDGQYGLGNHDIAENIFAALAGPVMGSLAITMYIAVLGSSLASLQSTVLGPARTMLAMGFYGALPRPCAHISPRYQSPGYATIIAGIIAFAFYAIMRVISQAVLWDTITAVGMMVCFYYGITAFACVWYFRRSSYKKLSTAITQCAAPLIGGIILLVVFIKTSIDAMNPDYGSGSSIAGIGLVFILGVVVVIIGVILMGIMWLKNPSFFAQGLPNIILTEDNQVIEHKAVERTDSGAA